MAEQLFFHSQSGPYGQRAAIKVKDGGNCLPIHIGVSNDDPPSAANNSMTISDAKLFRDKLTTAITIAEEAGL